MEIIKFNFNDQDLFKEAYAIRKEVFLEEQNADPEMEYDHEEASNFYLLKNQDTAIATARWRETDDGIKLERFAVKKSERGKNLGSTILDSMLKEVIPLKKKIYLHAQIQVVGFYGKYGFKKTGDIFEEANILHYKMVYQPA